MTRHPVLWEGVDTRAISWVEVLSEPEKASKLSQSGIDRAHQVTQQCPRAWGEKQKYKNHPSPWPGSEAHDLDWSWQEVGQ